MDCDVFFLPIKQLQARKYKCKYNVVEDVE